MSTNPFINYEERTCRIPAAGSEIDRPEAPLPRSAGSFTGSDMSLDDSIDRYTWSQPFNPFIAPAVAQPPFLYPQLPTYAATPAA